MLGYANIRKTKGHTVSLLLMFIIAALLFNLGLLIFVNFGSYFGTITKELNSSDVYYVMPNRLYSSEVDQYIRNNDNVLKMQKENTLWTMASIPYNGDTREIYFLMNDSDKNRDLSK